ncbi:conserved hypothetical protein [Vibrio harveyi]|nr:conserved hypothetical protein [Vibrio harveyi]CAH1547511.1 conserved hypothetical protein [Vibrio harveyi]CAH1548713.1 conserved hypothetical protein [Vibrio harveyi]
MMRDKIYRIRLARGNFACLVYAAQDLLQYPASSKYKGDELSTNRI